MTNGGGHHDREAKKQKAGPKKSKPATPKKALLIRAVTKSKPK